MGIYNQHFVDRLPMNKTPVEHLKDRYQDQDYQSIRNRLGKYGLEGHAHEVTMRDLSGGQKARVVFVDLSLQVRVCIVCFNWIFPSPCLDCYFFGKIKSLGTTYFAAW